jgi:hypothetical protein
MTKPILALMAMAALVWACGGCRAAAGPETDGAPPTFSGSSTDLTATQIVSTLEEPIVAGRNVVWCASSLAAWKTLEQDLAHEPVALDGDPPECALLNAAADPRPQIPDDALYTAAGWRQKGILEKITKEVGHRFPGKAPPAFPDIADDSFVAYSYLEARVKFALPYFQNDEPLEFTDAAGGKTQVSSFGVRQKDDYAYKALRQQAAVLFVEGGGFKPLAEYVVDLDRGSSPSQIVLALTERHRTLQETLARVQKKIASHKGHEGQLGINDVLLVPDMVWSISHRFAGLEGRAFRNPALAGQRLDVCQQDIFFRLDRCGAELKSEAKQYCTPIPSYYTFDRPFLLYMQKRGADMPYFVMWVDNAELLRKWEGAP